MVTERKSGEILLEVKSVTKKFGSLKALNRLSIGIEKGKITGLIGPNGAGKSTLFNVIVGELKPDDGKIVFRGKDITGLKPFQIARMGIGRTYQLIRIFSQMTAFENLMTASRTKRRDAEKKAAELLDRFRLLDYKDSYAGELSAGQQKILSVLRVLMFDADLMLLDELAAGVNTVEQEELMRFIHDLADREGKTCLIIEHDMDVIMGHCDKVICINFGEKLAEGSCQEVMNNEHVIEAYFG